MASVTNNEMQDENNLVGGVENGGGGGKGVSLKKGPWTAQEDAILIEYVTKHGEGNWNAVLKNTGLARCGKSCRLRWANHLRPNLKKGAFSLEEEKLIIELHAKYGNKWARMASLLPGRTDNEIKNYWNTRVKRRQRQGLPVYSNDVQPSPPCTNPSTPTAPTTLATQTYHFPAKSNYSLSPTPPLHSPLTSPHQPTSPYRPLPLFEPLSSFSSSTSSSFTFQRPAPLLCTPLSLKRFRASPSSATPSLSPYTPPISPPRPSYSSILDQHLSTPLSSTNSFQYPATISQNCSSVLQTQFESDYLVSPSSVCSQKLELPSIQFLQQTMEPGMTMGGSKVNEATLQSGGDILGDLLLEANSIASGQISRKRSYVDLKEESNLLDAYKGFEDLGSIHWPSSSEMERPKEEPEDLTLTIQEDLAALLDSIPPPKQVLDCFSDSKDVSNGQSSSIITDNHVVIDINPLLFPAPNTTDNNNNNETNGFSWPWDNLSEIC